MKFDENKNPFRLEAPERLGADHESLELNSTPGAVFRGDLYTPWDWIDLLIFALLALGTALLVSIASVVVFGVVLHVGAAQLRSPGPARTYFAVVNQSALSLLLLGYLWMQIRTRGRFPFWSTLGWRRLGTDYPGRLRAFWALIVGGALLSFLVEITSGALRPKGKLPMEAFFQDRRSALVLMLMSVLLAPIFEETLFRGYIYPAVARQTGIVPSVVITGSLFGLLHAPQLWGGWAQIGLLILVGIIFTCARARTGTVVASYLLHLSYNVFLFFEFLAGTRWFHVVPIGH